RGASCARRAGRTRSARRGWPVARSLAGRRGAWRPGSVAVDSIAPVAAPVHDGGPWRAANDPFFQRGQGLGKLGLLQQGDAEVPVCHGVLGFEVDGLAEGRLRLRMLPLNVQGDTTTVLESLPHGGLVRRGGVLTRVPAAWKTREIDFGSGPVQAITIPWGDVATAYRSSGIPGIEV